MDINQLYNAALAAQKSGQEAEAERLYRQILEQASPPEALVNLGNLLARQGRRDEALPLYDRALAARPDFLEGLFNRAGLLLELKRPEDALENYERVVTLRPDLFIAWNNRGSALRALQRHEEALASFERAAALNPSHVNALTNRAMALHDLRRLDGLAHERVDHHQPARRRQRANRHGLRGQEKRTHRGHREQRRVDHVQIALIYHSIEVNVNEV